VEAGSDAVALVWLRWSGEAEVAPWPITEMLDSAADRIMKSRY
jgi:hypothetical protein